MNDKFQNKYRIPSSRLKNWDYGHSAAYFITICTANREHFFGEIENANMLVSEIGAIAQQEWLKSTEIRPDMNLFMGDFVLMPNHFHAIVFIGDNQYNTSESIDGKPIVSTHLPNRFGAQSKNLASIVRGFKSAVTTYARKNNIPFDWQTRYHDHVIRNEAEYQKITHYIQYNVIRWEDDKLNEN
jgi:putative transposase